MQLREALNSAIQRLASQQVPSARMNAELLLRFVLNCDRAYIFAHPERELAGEESTRYEAALAERERGVPAQYITGHQEFWGMELMVSPAVLIPRPETEHLIEAVKELTSDLGRRTSGRTRQDPKTISGAGVQKAEARDPRSEVRIADVGTGSGAIALALAKELPEAGIYAIDISASALEVARANAARLQLESRIHFHQGDLLEGFAHASLDFVVSNPPYVGESEEDTVQLEVRKFEPRSAVFAGPEGTEIIARLIPQAREKLKPGGWLLMEISGTIADEVQKLLEGWEKVSLKLDLQGIPRVAIAHKPQ